jgi:hypothetical protein
MGYLSSRERDLGVCAALICPHCQALTRFLLREVSAALSFYGLRLLTVDRCYQLFCSSCKFRKDLNSRELLPARRAIRLFARLESGEITAAQYLQELGGLEFPTLYTLREEAKAWTCSRCMETVPEELGSCWKCNSMRPELEAMAPTEEFHAPELPRVISRPSNPWEGP